MKKLLIATLVLFAVLFMFILGCDPDDPDEPYPPPNIDHNFGEMTDPRNAWTYKTIEIGTQTWMADNLNYETGNSWCYDNDTNNCNTYGRLYDWDTARKVCPDGWHLPRDAQWAVLTEYLGGIYVAGGKMKSTCGLWQSPNKGATNESGWSAFPGGRLISAGAFDNLGIAGTWWSSTGSCEFNALYWHLYYGSGALDSGNGGKNNCFSVRCVKDKGPYSISGSFSGVDVESVEVFLTGDDEGSVVSDANGNYRFSGLENGTYTVTPEKSGYTFSPPNQSVTISGSDKTDMDFTVEIENPFNPDLTYGEFTDERDGQTYKTIEIGSQTWMAENLNYQTGKGWCYNNDTNNCNIYGRLYDWYTAILACPPDWYLPSDEEWQELIDYLDGEDVAGGKMKSSSSLWKFYQYTNTTNESGWSGLPGGWYFNYGNLSSFYDLGISGYWWSSTKDSTETAWHRDLHYYYDYVDRITYHQGAYGLSVRCIKY